MSRKKIPSAIETQVLTNSRRRCCVCFGLEKNIDIKKGQIAHLNGNRDDNRLENLVFLCFDHHDQFDTVTSQSKNLTKNEIRKFRQELNNQIVEIWRRPMKLIDNQHRDLAKIISGRYIREGHTELAELEIMYIGNKRIKIQGIAFWGTKNKLGPNIGQLDFESDLLDNKTVFSEKRGNELYRIIFEFNGNEILADEEFITGYFGANVSFGGLYEKIK